MSDVAEETEEHHEAAVAVAAAAAGGDSLLRRMEEEAAAAAVLAADAASRRRRGSGAVGVADFVLVRLGGSASREPQKVTVERIQATAKEATETEQSASQQRGEKDCRRRSSPSWSWSWSSSSGICLRGKHMQISTNVVGHTGAQYTRLPKQRDIFS